MASGGGDEAILYLDGQEFRGHNLPVSGVRPFGSGPDSGTRFAP
jgi:hypothetical protein